MKLFLKPVFSGRAVKAEGKEKLLDLLNKEKPYYSMLLLFVGSASYSADTFLQTFVRDPTMIQSSYLPFV